MKKTSIVLTLSMILTLTVCSAPRIFAAQQADSGEDYSIAYINDYQGECEMVKKGGGEPEPVQDIYIPLYEGDTVSTGDSGSLEIVFDDATIINLDENSSLTIERLSRGNGDKTILSLIKGSLTAIVKKLMGGDEFKVKTNMAMAAVKGTEFSVTADDDQKIGVFDGTVEVSGLDRSGRAGGTIMVSKGSETQIDRFHRIPGRPRSFGPGMMKRQAGLRGLRQRITNLRALARSGGLRKFKLNRRLERINSYKKALKSRQSFRTMPEKRRAAMNRAIMQEQRIKQQRDALDRNDKKGKKDQKDQDSQDYRDKFKDRNRRD